jgi:hypothetical protein
VREVAVRLDQVAAADAIEQLLLARGQRAGEVDANAGAQLGMLLDQSVERREQIERRAGRRSTSTSVPPSSRRRPTSP